MNNVHVVYVEVVYILDHFTIRKFPMSLQINGNIDWLKQSFNFLHISSEAKKRAQKQLIKVNFQD